MRSSLLITLCVVAGLFAGGALFFLFPQSFGLAPAPAPQIKTSGKALIGGPFSLVDQNGKRVSEKTYAGKFMLVYFGYTFCPDVCPTELQVMSTALDLLGSQAKRIQPIFITIDPARDTAAVLADYMSNFHDSFIGLTGTPQEIRAVTKKYRVYYAKVKEKGSGEDYLMDHSSIIYLMNERGEFVKHFSFGISPSDLAAGIRKFL